VGVTSMNPAGWPIAVAFLLGLADPLSTHGAVAAPAADSSSEVTDAERLFVRRIAPLLAGKCAACHGTDADAVEGGLSLANRDSALSGGDSGSAAILPDDPAASPLLRAVLRDDAQFSPMPPKEAERLSAQEVGWLREWLAGGAPWPSGERVAAISATHESVWAQEDGVTIATSGGLSPEWDARRYDPAALWAYRPVVKSMPPAAAPGTHPIDAFLAARLPAGIEPAPAADRRTLLRRVTFDLTGLPPTTAEVEEFLTDRRDDATAFSAVVERLLASPHYGERMAQHWLDVTRYADSSGFSNDYERGNAWRYRDYVVRAFNDDKPYDRFIREQLAGDELAPDDPEHLIATGFLRMGPWELTGMEVEKVARQRFLDDVVNSVGETFLAHSLQCARCHDHKFDPVPTRDYYAIQAVFATTQLAERSASFLPAENTGGFEERAYLEKTLAAHEATLSELDRMLLVNAERWFADQGKDPCGWNAAVEDARSSTGGRGRKGRQFGKFDDVFATARKSLLDAGVSEGEFPPKLVGFTPDQFGLERVARKGLERLRWELDRYEPYALAVYSGRTREHKTVVTPLRVPGDRLTAGAVEESCILIGGDPFTTGPKVGPGVLSVIDAAGGAGIPNSIEGRRTAFADWVASAENPLASRTIVNRVWMWHFGRAIAGNPNNFGVTGKRPTHPELLDWLAASFVEQGWSIKSLHRLILSSAAYRRSAAHPDRRTLAERDPDETSYAVFLPRRLSAEELRDAMLAASGELNPVLGGIPNRPEIHLEAALQPRQVMGTFAAAWVPNPQPHQRHRRSLYALRLRGLGDPTLEVFNAPAADFSCERREVSTVTPQVFALFNGKAALSRALALASRVLAETQDDEEALQRCFTLVYGRSARPEELVACLAHWREMEALQSQAVPVAWKQPVEVRRDAVEENTGEHFSFTETLHANVDFIPDVQPADCDARTRGLADVCLVLLNTNEFAYVF
jgi:mono/diheme cytochrome c family protein